MSQDPQQLPPIFGPIDVSAESSTTELVQIPADPGNQLTAILQQISEKMDRQNELLEQLVQQEEPLDDPRSIELDRWRKANPDLAQSCRFAAETLSRAQTEFLEQLTNEVCESDDALLDSNFMLGEFVDRYGPRLAHLNGVLQVLSQLSSPPSSE
jgi:predicted DsbA family dithiol-disulfide isomerase